MNWYALDNRQKIVGIMDLLISNKTEIVVRIVGDKTAFTSKLLTINQRDASSATGREPELILDKLVPHKGNDLIQSFPDVVMEFFVNENSCRCSVRNIGVSNIPPYYGFVMSFPEALEIKEKREDERVAYETPEFVSVEFRLEKGPEKDKTYCLDVIDRSRSGFGLLITQKDFDLLRALDAGDKLANMTLYSESIMIKMDATVRHKTKIQEGKYRGCYILGIETHR